MIERLVAPVAAIVAAICLLLASCEHIQADRARAQLVDLRLQVSESTRRQTEANARELARRALKQSEVLSAQVEATATAEAAADRARTERDGLRRDLAAFVAAHTGPDPAPPGASPPADPTVAVLADLLGQCAERREELARFADRSHAAGQACERSYDALTVE